MHECIHAVAFLTYSPNLGILAFAQELFQSFANQCTSYIEDEVGLVVFIVFYEWNQLIEIGANGAPTRALVGRFLRSLRQSSRFAQNHSHAIELFDVAERGLQFHLSCYNHGLLGVQEVL